MASREDTRVAVGDFPVVGIAASAGGVEALGQLLAHVPDQCGLALAVIVPLASDRASGLAEELQRKTPLRVLEAADGMLVERDHVYILPPNAEMTFGQGGLHLHARPSGAGRFRPADRFFSSLAEDQKSAAIGVMLSGADGDGAEGLQAIKHQRGSTFGQDATAIVPLPPEAIARELVRIAGQCRQPAMREGAGLAEDASDDRLDEEQFQEILQLLHQATGVDFREYKPNTIRRRILRRMDLHRISGVDEFLGLLRGNHAELQSLHTDILVHVTQFFRDPDAFEALRTSVVREIVDRVGRPRDSIRIWVPGCATGEEVYSIAICVLEALDGSRAHGGSIQIFGTDVSELAIEKARAGAYSKDIVSDVSEDRLRRFFTRVDSVFLVNKSVRDLCVFARHDMAHDPPLSRLDLISCRNVLIYMSAALQKQILPLFHDGLNENGSLFLGTAESIGRSPELFRVLDQHASIYRKAGVARTLRRPAPQHHEGDLQQEDEQDG